MNVRQGLFVLLIDNDFDEMFRDVLRLKIFLNVFSCVIGGSVINVYNVIVIVVLHENRVQIT